MSLQAKILQLKLEAALAVKHANGWQRLIDLYGEPKATAFYTHLGLNHLPRKSFDYEGLTLSREPKEHEKIAVKGIAQAQESSKEAITKILLDLRTELIADGLKGIKKLKPAKYHELTLQASPESRTSLRGRLIEVHKQGRLLVSTELGQIGAPKAKTPTKADETDVDDLFDDLELLTALTNGRVANDVQARIIAAAQRFSLLGLNGITLLDAVTSEINAGSVSYIDRAAGETAHKVIAFGRADEMRNRSDEIERYEYSALLDQNTCDPCLSLDGTTAQSMDELPEVPLADCLGGGMCRCFIVAVSV